jgi:hypothetical protein
LCRSIIKMATISRGYVNLLPPWYFKQCVIRYHDQCNLAICHTVPQPVYFTWQCVMWYHDQCNLAMCHAVPQPLYFTWQCLIRYHNQCLSPGNVSCGTQVKYTGCGTVWHIARLHWSWYRMTHCHVKYTDRGTIWHILTHDQVGIEYKISTNWETITVFDNIYAFVSIGNARLLTSMWLITNMAV